MSAGAAAELVRCRAYDAQLHGLALVPDLELSAATVIDPDAVGVIAPAISELARRFADLSRNVHTTASLDSTVLTRSKVGRAF